MTNFYILTVVLTVLSALFVIVPLVRKAKRHKLQISNANVVKQRIEELDRELEEGLISEKDKASAVRELKLALVEESEQFEKHIQINHSEDGQSERAVNGPLVILLSMPAIVLGIWVYFNANQLDGLQQYISAQSEAAELTRLIQGEGSADVTPNDYAKFALVIRKKLRDTPDDVEGWRLLGQVQMAIGRMEESIAAFEKALELEPRNLALRERYAQVLMATSTEESLENAKRQVSYLISLAPENRDYRLLMTVVATQLGDVDTALSNFMMIREQLSAQSNFYQSLVAQLINIGASPEFFDDFDAQTFVTNDESMAGVTQPLVNKEDKNLVNVTIALSDELQSKLPQNGYLIVFAQNADTDSRVPLAVQRIPLPRFPVLVSLGEEDAMMASFTLSSAENVRIVARISKDADVMPSAGELQGQIDKLQLDKGKALQANITINKEL